MPLYTIPEDSYFSNGKKFPALKPNVIGFDFKFKLFPSAFYRAIRPDIQKIGGVTLDPLKQQILRLGYRCIDYKGALLPSGTAELHAYPSLNGRYVVGPRKIGTITENQEYHGTVLYNRDVRKVTYTVYGFSNDPVIKIYDFNCSQFSIFGIGGYMQYPYFEDNGFPAPHNMDFDVTITPLYGSAISKMDNFGRSALGLIKAPGQWINVL
jgi:hypothetical protein